MTNTDLLHRDSQWPEQFSTEAAEIKKLLRELANDIQHIGSTSIPGLLAKPIIDIGVLADSIDDVELFVTALTPLGYEYNTEMSSAERIFLRKGSPVTYHLSITSPDFTFWDRNITFRDYLKTHPELIKEYETLKQRNLFQTSEEELHDLSRSRTYNKGKGDFVQKVLVLAKNQ